MNQLSVLCVYRAVDAEDAMLTVFLIRAGSGGQAVEDG